MHSTTLDYEPKVGDRVTFSYKGNQEHGLITDVIKESSIVIVDPQSKVLKAECPHGFPLENNEIQQVTITRKLGQASMVDHKPHLQLHGVGPRHADSLHSALHFGEMQPEKRSKICLVVSDEDTSIVEVVKARFTDVDFVIVSLHDMEAVNAINPDDYRAVLLLHGEAVFETLPSQTLVVKPQFEDFPIVTATSKLSEPKQPSKQAMGRTFRRAPIITKPRGGGMKGGYRGRG